MKATQLTLDSLTERDRISRIDRATCRMLASEIEAALQSIAAKHSISVRAVGGRFSEHEYTCKVECQVKNASGIPANFAAEARALGLPEDCHGKTFRSDSGRSFVITGIELRRHKMPVSAKDPVSGGNFKFSVAVVLRGLRSGT